MQHSEHNSVNYILIAAMMSCLHLHEKSIHWICHVSVAQQCFIGSSLQSMTPTWNLLKCWFCEMASKRSLIWAFSSIFSWSSFFNGAIASHPQASLCQIQSSQILHSDVLLAMMKIQLAEKWNLNKKKEKVDFLHCFGYKWIATKNKRASSIFLMRLLHHAPARAKRCYEDGCIVIFLTLFLAVTAKNETDINWKNLPSTDRTVPRKQNTTKSTVTVLYLHAWYFLS